MGEDFIKVVVVPGPKLSAEWQTYRPKPTSTTVRAKVIEHDFTVEGQDLAGSAGDFLIDSGGQLGVMTAAQFRESFSAVRGPRPVAKPAPAEPAK